MGHWPLECVSCSRFHNLPLHLKDEEIPHLSLEIILVSWASHITSCRELLTEQKEMAHIYATQFVNHNMNVYSLFQSCFHGLV